MRLKGDRPSAFAIVDVSALPDSSIFRRIDPMFSDICIAGYPKKLKRPIRSEPQHDMT